MSVSSASSKARLRSKHFAPIAKWVRFSGAAYILALMLCPSTVSAAVTEATLFRDEVSIQENRKLTLYPDGKDRYRASFFLPAQADPKTLVAWPAAGSKLRILDVKWQPVAPGDSEEARKIRRDILSVREERNRLRAQLQALEAQIQFWQLQAKAKVKTINEAQTLTTAMGRHIRKAWEEKYTREQDLETVEGRIRSLEENLAQILGRELPSWEVTVLFAGPRSSETTLSLLYTASGGGWLPLYRLDARPGQGQIFFSRGAEIWQKSGQDWSDVLLTLSSHKAGSALLSPDLSAGSIASPSAPASPDSTKHDMIMPVLISVGKENLPSGTGQIVELEKGTWPADFTYLARPGIDDRVILQASIQGTLPKDVMSGQAILLNDGTYAGKGNLSLTSDKSMVSFGPDPLIRLTDHRLTSLSCVKDGGSDRKICEGQWQIELRNDRSRPVTVRIEAARPQAGNERIQLSLHSEPPPAEQDGSKIVWVLQVPSGRTAAVVIRVRLSVPQDLEFDFGWR